MTWQGGSRCLRSRPGHTALGPHRACSRSVLACVGSPRQPDHFKPALLCWRQDLEYVHTNANAGDPQC